MYSDGNIIYISSDFMPLQIANPVVVAKVERAARAAGMSKTAVVEHAIDRMTREIQKAITPDRMGALLAQMDQIPDRPDAADPLEWDANGLPI